MFKFLFGRGEGKVVKETQRQTVERALGEVNEILVGLTEKPKLSIDMTSGQLEIALPEQMPDEALALPAPEKEKEVTPETQGEEAAPEKETTA